MPRNRSWKPDNPDHHWPDRNDVKDRFERAKVGINHGEEFYYSIYYFDADGVKRSDEEACDAIALDIDIMGRGLRFRRWDMNKGKPIDNGHPKRYDLEREALAKLIKYAEIRGCECSDSSRWEVEYTDSDTHDLNDPDDYNLYDDWI